MDAYELPANEALYKGMDTLAMDMYYNKPCWFSQSEETAKQFGPHVHTVLTKRPLKLINITSPQFHNRFMDYLKTCYQNYGVSIAMSPMEDFLPLLGGGNSKHIAFFYNHQRFCEMEIDDLFQQFIHSQHSVDGYISPCIWPAKKYVNISEEICLFNMRSIQHSSLNTYEDKVPSRRMSLEPKISHKYVERNTWRTIEMLKDAGWTGEYEISCSIGLLTRPTHYELGEFTRAKHEAKKRATQLL